MASPRSLRPLTRQILVLALAALALSLPAAAAVNRWTPLGPGGGEVRSLALDPDDPVTLLAAMGRAGLYVSPNGGESWVWSGTGMAGLSVGVVASDPDTPDTFYAAAGNDSTPDVVFRSVNGGASWQPVLEIEPAAGGVRAFAAAGGTVYAMAGQELYTSQDSGTTWHLVFAGGDLIDLAVDPQNPEKAYLATPIGLYRTTNAGAVWTPAAAGPQIVDLRSVAVAPSRPATLYAITGTTLYRSDDGGATWTAGTKLIAYAYDLAVDPRDPGTVYLYGYDVTVSRDGGATLQKIETGLPHGEFAATLPVWALVIRPDRPGTLYAGTYREGVYLSTTGGRRWRPAANAGLDARRFDWIQTNPAVPAQLDALSNGQLFRSLDRGATWSRLNAGASTRNEVRVDARTLLRGTAGGLVRSTDDGRTWTEVLDSSIPPPEDDFYAGRSVRWIKNDPADPRIVYARADDYFVHHHGPGIAYFVRSLDGGATWRALPAVFDVVEIEPGHPRTLYAAGPDHIYKSVNGGLTWKTLGALTHGTDLEVDPRAPSTIYAGTQANGVWRSPDGGVTWAPANAGLARLGRRHIVDLEISPGIRGLVYATPLEGGLFQSLFGGSADAPTN
ncbi:MAG TPA: hypothetical protein VHU81_01645 [Thermoanaerobaculia bacterium]|nr:hypothetical protein [Thermoanaerobaculia bacterium]